MCRCPHGRSRALISDTKSKHVKLEPFNLKNTFRVFHVFISAVPEDVSPGRAQRHTHSTGWGPPVLCTVEGWVVADP